MDNYIQNKLKDYLKELQENNFKINSGRKLELITAYKNNSLLYEDVPEYIKDKYDLPSRDEGIDVIKLNNEEIIETYQCKDYGSKGSSGAKAPYNGRVSNHKLGTYFGFHLYQLKNIPFNIVGSTNTVFNSTIKPIIYDINEDFGEYTEEDKEVCVLDNLRWYQIECIEKIEKLYLDLISNINNDGNYILEPISSLCEESEIDSSIDSEDIFISDLEINSEDTTINDSENISEIDLEIDSEINSENTSITDLEIDSKDTSITNSEINIEDTFINDSEDTSITHSKINPKDTLITYSKLNHKDTSPIITNKEFRIRIPCGCGKTAVMYYFGVFGYNTLILVPKINIATQIKNYFENTLNKVVNTYWTNTNNNNNSNVTICVYDSVDKIKSNKYDMIFVDEAHHIIGSKLYKYYNEVIQIKESYINTIEKLECTLKVYLSATIDVKHFENSYELDFNRAIKEGYLTDYEFNILYVEPNFEENYRKLVKIINENKEYKHIIIYCNRIETAEYINDLLNKHKIISHVIVSRSDNSTELKREKILEDFRNGLVKVLCSVNCLNEGTDLPIADTCMFVNDRGSEINIIQCIGRVLRKYKYKSKARIVLFDTNPDDAELKYENYMRVMDKIDSGFKQDLKHKLKIYNYSRDYKFDLKIKEKENQYFDKIIRFRLSWEDKLRLCQEFYDNYKRLPMSKETYKGFGIGSMLYDIRKSNNKNKINQLEKIFHCKLFQIGEKKDILFQNNILLCEKFNNIHHRWPKRTETIDGFNIGYFVGNIIYRKEATKLDLLIKIFGPFKNKEQLKNERFEEYFKQCELFKTKFNKIPSQNDKFNGYGIGKFVDDVRKQKYKHNEYLLNRLEKIFGKIPKIKHYEKIYTFDEKINMCNVFYKKNKRLPSKSEIDENGWHIGYFIHNSKRLKNKKTLDQLEEIFHCKL